MLKKQDYIFAGIVFCALLIGVFSMTKIVDAQNTSGNTAEAIFAGGCFWCTESDLEKLDGVNQVVSGYIGGHVKNPSYEQVVSGKTGHREAVRVVYNPDVISYETLLDAFWKTIDPFDDKGQFCDKGFQYTSAIYYTDDDHKALIERNLRAKEKQLGQKIVTAVEPVSEFYDAEDYHQDFYQKNPIRYRYYRFGCGRDRRTAEVWDD